MNVCGGSCTSVFVRGFALSTLPVDPLGSGDNPAPVMAIAIVVVDFGCVRTIGSRPAQLLLWPTCAASSFGFLFTYFLTYLPVFSVCLCFCRSVSVFGYLDSDRERRRRDCHRRVFPGNPSSCPPRSLIGTGFGGPSKVRRYFITCGMALPCAAVFCRHRRVYSCCGSRLGGLCPARSLRLPACRQLIVSALGLRGIVRQSITYRIATLF